jgi:hypothetical protein
MWTAFPSSDYYADSATPRAHQQASHLARLPPAARRARDASHVHLVPFDRVGNRLYRYSASGGRSQSPTGHHARAHHPGVERAAVNQSGIVAVDGPCPPGFGPFVVSSGFYHRIALALPFGLAGTHAGVWRYRPAVTLSGRLATGARSRASAVPSFAGPLRQPGSGIPAGTDEMFDVLHLLSQGASWRTINYYGRFYRSALNPLLRRVNAYVRRWAGRKYKRLRTQKRYGRWLAGLLSRQPDLFAHWRLERSY